MRLVQGLKIGDEKLNMTLTPEIERAVRAMADESIPPLHRLGALRSALWDAQHEAEDAGHARRASQYRRASYAVGNLVVMERIRQIREHGFPT